MPDDSLAGGLKPFRTGWPHPAHPELVEGRFGSARYILRQAQGERRCDYNRCNDTSSHRPITKAIDNAIRFLIAGQDRSGAWPDFRLKPGRADAWTTAYIGARLAETGVAEADHALAAAVAFMRSARAPKGGWRYNRHCPIDADSTALACLFLAARGVPPSPADFARLATFQTPAGGFATYRFADDDHGWCRPRAEVTATALRALMLVLPPDHDRMRRGRSWLRDRVEGRLPYWWTSPAYLELERARIGLAMASRTVTRAEDGAFAIALAAELAMYRGDRDRAENLVARLTATQRADGGWPSSPILRVVDPKARSWGDPRLAGSPVARDDRRLFTTATALAALMRFVRTEVTNPPEPAPPSGPRAVAKEPAYA